MPVEKEEQFLAIKYLSNDAEIWIRTHTCASLTSPKHSCFEHEQLLEIFKKVGMDDRDIRIIK